MHLIGRRNFVAGMGLGVGAHLLGAMAKVWLPEAMGANPTRKRLIIFTAANGFLEPFFKCPTRSETDFDLTPQLSPLAAYKSQMVIAHKFFNPHDKALHGNQYATLSVMPTTDPTTDQLRGPPGGISIDRFLASKIGACDAFSSTAAGCVSANAAGFTAGQAMNVSCDGPNKPFPAFGNPTKAFETYFGTKTASGGLTQDKLQAADKSFLDFLRSDIGRMRGRLAAAERAKLDQYTDSLRALEKQLADVTAVRAACSSPSKPNIEAFHGAANEGLDPVTLTGHIDVTLAAQMCGLTRISHIAIEGMEGPHINYSWLKDPKNHHDDHHDNNMPVLAAIATFWFQQVARMVDALAKTSEGNGTMLDNSLVVFVNTCGGSHHGGHDDHPVITIGKAGGELRVGRSLVYPRTVHCISDLFVSMANVFGVPIETFGDPKFCKGPLPGWA